MSELRPLVRLTLAVRPSPTLKNRANDYRYELRLVTMIEIGGMALIGWVVPGAFAVALILIVSGYTTSSRCQHTDLATVHRDPAAELKSVVCVDCGWKHVCHIDAKHPDKVND